MLGPSCMLVLGTSFTASTNQQYIGRTRVSLLCDVAGDFHYFGKSTKEYSLPNGAGGFHGPLGLEEK